MKAQDITLRWVLRRRPDNGPDSAEAVVGHPCDDTHTPLLSIADTNLHQLFAEQPVDFLVDFSGPEGCEFYAAPAREAGIGVISAISSYAEPQLQLLRALATGQPVLHSPNITVGINFIMMAAKMLQKLAPQADIEIVEEHFRSKREISGTARRIAQELGLDENHHLNSIRVGGIVGRHEVIFGFPYQTVRLAHESISRHAFGQGALFALRALIGRQAGFYTMEQLIAENFAAAQAS